MHFSEIETLTYYRAQAEPGAPAKPEEPLAAIAWGDLPDKVRRAIRAEGALLLAGDYPAARRKAEIETEVAVFSGNGQTAKIVARDRRMFELIEDHVVHRRVAAVFRAIEAAVFAMATDGKASRVFLEDLPEPPALPAIPDWLEPVEFACRPYAEKDFEAVLARGAEAAAALRAVVEWAAANPDAAAALPDDYALLVNAILLLGDLRDKAAFPAIVRFVSTPEAICERALGDLITEELPEVLARTYDGNFALLATLIENPDAYEFSRWSALDALACLLWDDALSREAVVDYFGDLVARTIAREDTDIAGAIACTVADLRFEELVEPVRRLFAEGLIHPGEITLPSFRESFREAGPPHRHVAPDAELWGYQTGAYWLTPRFLKDQADASRRQRSPEEKSGGWREVAAGGTPFAAAPKIGRNDPCPCGSGKKYKKCCGAVG